MSAVEKLRQTGVIVPELVMPRAGTELSKYACIACDQYNAEPEYWEEVKSYVGKAPSSLYFIMPEAWLDSEGKPDSEEHRTHQELLAANMKFFLVDGSLDELEPGMVYVERRLSDGRCRRGLLLAFDLEHYEYAPGNKALMRATEKTVDERIPVRTAIRSASPLECPHIMVLYSDREKRMEKLGLENRKALYDFELMKNAGHIKGFHITDEESLNSIADVLLELKAEADELQDGMLFAVGDGNHSLAAAKTHWDSFKQYIPELQREDHPARFALVELVNIYDEGLSFEPINRIIKNIDPKQLQQELGFDASCPPSLQELQPKLDEYRLRHPEMKIDYIHGAELARSLKAQDPEHRLAICWSEFDRGSLFSDVIKNGSLVRKSFSMGRADDKRFYLEARRITKISKEHIVPNASWGL